MEDLRLPVTYFAEPGSQNTAATLAIAGEHARSRAIEHVVVASDTGKTARAAIEALGQDRHIVVVTNPTNLRFPVAKLHDYLPHFREHKQELMAQGKKAIACSLSSEVVRELQDAGVVVTRIDWKRFQGFVRINLAAIDWVGVGVRVGLTVAIWATLAKSVPPDVDVITVTGTGFGGGGADTAVVVRTAKTFKEFRVMEVLAKPRVSPPSELAG